MITIDRKVYMDKDKKGVRPTDTLFGFYNMCIILSATRMVQSVLIFVVNYSS